MCPFDATPIPALMPTPAFPMTTGARSALMDEAGTTLDDALRRLRAAEAVIAQQRLRIAQLETLSVTDELTGLLNRRGFLDAFGRASSSARRSGQGGTLVLIDLDGFKAVNDGYGHACGDAYLRATASALCQLVRAHDPVARLGGDEFAVLLTGVDSATGKHRAVRLAADFHDQVCRWQDRALPLRASFGACAFQPGAQIETILAAADADMYRAKAGQR